MMLLQIPVQIDPAVQWILGCAGASVVFVQMYRAWQILRGNPASADALTALALKVAAVETVMFELKKRLDDLERRQATCASDAEHARADKVLSRVTELAELVQKALKRRHE